VDRIPLAHRVLTFVHNYCKIITKITRVTFCGIQDKQATFYVGIVGKAKTFKE